MYDACNHWYLFICMYTHCLPPTAHTIATHRQRARATIRPNANQLKSIVDTYVQWPQCCWLLDSALVGKDKLSNVIQVRCGIFGSKMISYSSLDKDKSERASERKREFYSVTCDIKIIGVMLRYSKILSLSRSCTHSTLGVYLCYRHVCSYYVFVR